MKLMRIFLIFILSFFLASCGFQLRSADTLPPILHCLYLESSNPYSVFHSLLAENLRGLHVTVVDLPSQAPITLVIIANELSHNDPGVVSSNMAIPYTFTLHTVIALETPKGAIITGPASFSTSRTIVLNSNQIINSSIGLPAQQDLMRNNIQKIYFWLISQDTKNALGHYANHSRRTKTAH